jgi:hypothetical protein
VGDSIRLLREQSLCVAFDSAIARYSGSCIVSPMIDRSPRSKEFFLESESLSLFQKTKRKYLVPADVSTASVVTNRLEFWLCPSQLQGIRA